MIHSIKLADPEENDDLIVREVYIKSKIRPFTTLKHFRNK
jgi:hypothetical protein